MHLSVAHNFVLVHSFQISVKKIPLYSVERFSLIERRESRCRAWSHACRGGDIYHAVDSHCCSVDLPLDGAAMIHVDY